MSSIEMGNESTSNGSTLESSAKNIPANFHDHRSKHLLPFEMIFFFCPEQQADSLHKFKQALN